MTGTGVFAPARDVANAVLYEGYILYPYTASARKNRIRWQFGVVVPQAYAARGTGEAAEAQTEVLLACAPDALGKPCETFDDACEAGGDTCEAAAEVAVLVRFLQVEERRVEAFADGAFAPVGSLVVDEKIYLTFDEGVEREIAIPLRVGSAAGPASRVDAPIAFGPHERVEILCDGDDAVVRGRIVRRLQPLHGAITVTCEPVSVDLPLLRKLRVRIENHSSIVAGERSSALRTAFVSTHVLLHVERGHFLSALDPPEEATAATAALGNRHTWPVLVGDSTADAQRASLVLSSPIILYDFPAVAPQSEADTFDATEVDELMMLSVLSLSDREREEARATDPRARAIVERAERMGPQELARLHGTLLSSSLDGGFTKSNTFATSDAFSQGDSSTATDPLTRTDPFATSDPFATIDVPATDCVFIEGVKIARGSAVRLHPKRRADVWDTFLENKLATVRAVHQTVEDETYVAVTVDDDPASDLHDWYGRSLFFSPDEVEPVAANAPERVT